MTSNENDKSICGHFAVVNTGQFKAFLVYNSVLFVKCTSMLYFYDALHRRVKFHPIMS